MTASDFGAPRAQVLILGTAEWNSPIATNQHYMARELAQQFDVTFVESLGLRKLEFTQRDLTRIANRLIRKLRPSLTDDRRRSVSKPSRAIPANLRVLSPVVIPRHRGLTARINGVLLRRQLRSWLQSDRQRVLWTYTPVTYGLEQHASATIYHCVDLLAESPGKDRIAIETNERRLADNGIPAIASSLVVALHLQRAGFTNVETWPNVADVETILAAASEAGARHPRAVFAGNLSEAKIDFELLEALLDAGVELELAGPISEGGGNSRSRVDRLVAAGATYHGTLSLEDLGRLYATCTVGLIPYAVNSLTRGVNPLKTYEYLAAGLAVVSTPVPAVIPREHDVLVAATYTQFIDAVVHSLAEGAAPHSLAEEAAQPPSRSPGDTLTPAIARRQSIARQHSWHQRGEQARTLVTTLLATPTPIAAHQQVTP